MRLLVEGILLYSLFAGSAFADEVYGRIRGVVTDPSGAVVAGATITATNVATGIKKEVKSATDGTYEFLQLAAPSIYSVAAKMTGFKNFEASNLSLGLTQVYVLNIQLEVGSVTQTVTVEAAPAQVETTSMQLGKNLTASAIVDLPLNGRNWIQLQQTLPGVVAADRFSNNYATNGSRSQANSYLVNGTDANDLPINTPLIVPSPDAIAEVSLVTNTINPEYGRNGGAILNATTKSGSNQFHGTAFEFYRDTFLNTRNFFSPSQTIFHQNQIGGTIGGPIKKDKAFFFFSYQKTKNRTPEPASACGDCSPGTSTVYTPAERGGDFSASGPLSGVSAFPLVGEDGRTYPTGTNYSVLFPTSHIPTADLNPLAVSLTNKYVPLPTTGSLYEFNPVETNNGGQYITRIDYNLSSKDAIWGYWFYQPKSIRNDAIPFFGGDLPGFGQVAPSRTAQYTLDWSHTFGGNMLNEARFGYNRLNFQATFPASPVLPSAVGFTGINPQYPQGAGVPKMTVQGFFKLGFSNNGPQPRIDQTYQFADNLSKIVGTHTLKFGVDIRRSEVFNPYISNNNGTFTFAGSGTYTTGNPGADFLLGIPDSYSQASGSVIDARTQTYYAYAQDQWKVQPNLTFTYGVGWEADTPLRQKFDGGLAINCFNPGVQSTIFPTAPVGLTFPGDPRCSSSGGATTRLSHFGPRLGFAFSPDAARKWSIRGGLGIYYNRTEEEPLLQTLGSVPFSLTDAGIGDVGGSPAFATPFTDISTGQSIPNKYPFTPAKPGAAVDFTQFEPLSIAVVDPNITVPYSINYNLTVERELPGAAILSVAYVGLQGNNLTNAVELNPAGSEAGNPVCLATPGCNAFTNYFTAPQTFRYPQTNASGVLVFGSVGQMGTFIDSNYSALQITLDKKTTHGLNFRATYAWSHSLDFASSFEDLGFSGVRGLDPFNYRANYGDSAFDARQRLVFTYVYDIPSVRRYSSFQGLPSRLTDGWRITGITTFQTGIPITVGSSSVRSDTCNATFEYFSCWDRPNVVKPVTTYDARQSIQNNSLNGTRAPRGDKSNYFFDPNAFQLEAAGTLGNAGRNFFHGPGINNFDFALMKDTHITESTRIELRFEFFNLFNHTNFSTLNGVNGNAGSSNFGRALSARTPIDSRIVQLAAKFYF